MKLKFYPPNTFEFYHGQTKLVGKASRSTVREFAKSILRKIRPRRVYKKCAVNGCDSKAKRHALCDYHYWNK